MTALSLFDSVLHATAAPLPGDTADVARLVRVAHRLVHAALSDLSEIESLDACLAPPDDNAQAFDAQSALLLRGMYEQWTRDAGAVLERVAKVRQLGVNVDGAERLADAQGRLLAMLSVTLDDIEQGRRGFRQGRTWTREEIRGELGLGV